MYVLQRYSPVLQEDDAIYKTTPQKKYSKGKATYS